MKSAFRLFLIILIMFTFTSLSFAAENSVSREEFMKVINELKAQRAKDTATIQKLTDEVKTLKVKEETRKDTNLDVLKEEVEELSELMQVVEKKSLLDKIQIGAELRTRCDWFDYKERVSGFGKSYRDGNEEEVHALMSNRFRLNLKAEINSNLVFHGRLTMYKNWMDNDYGNTLDYRASRRPSDNDLKVERAYVDYYFQLHEKLPMALSFGRLPMADGLPTDLRENTPRKATFPSLAYDTEGDGAGLSIMLDKLTGLKNSAIRFIYLRTVDDNDVNQYRESDIDLTDTNYYITQFETMLPGKYLKDILFILNFVVVPDIPSPDLTGQGLIPIDLPHTMGDMWYFTTFMQAKNFLGSNFDWFAGFTYFDLDTHGGPVQYGLGPIPINITFNNKDNRSEKNATAYHIGFRYNIPIDFLNNPKFGVEYNHGSKYWMSNTGASEDPLNKLATRGYAWDFYYIQPVNKNLTFRLGHTFVRNRYKMGMSGPDHVRQKIKNTYILLDAKF